VEEQAGLVQEIARQNGGEDFEWATHAEDRYRLWAARHQAYFAALELRRGARSVTTDVCAPISRLADCMVATADDIAAATMPIPMFGHVGDGNLHCMVPVRRDNAEDRDEVDAFNQRLVNRALAMEGTCTGEHGIGMGKIASLEAEHGEAIALMRAIKRALDPDNLFNPGKVLPV
jgi:D-lactate dehydrogenase (cytochrome)